LLDWLTPEERRGAVALVIILLLGAGHDAWRARRMRLELRDATRVPASLPAPAAPRADHADAVPLAAAVGGRLDLNRATAGDLEALPGIGPVLARRIVEARTRMGGFRRLEELLAVRGVGPRLFERVRPLLDVSGAEPMHSAASPRRGRADSASAAPSTSR
jgi:competence ComEA-like helix-hairpin-helix protein